VKVKITDREALSSLKTVNIEKWLIAHGWVRCADGGSFNWTQYQKGSTYTLLPNDETPDFVLRVSELMDFLEDVEGLDQMTIFEGMDRFSPAREAVVSKIMEIHSIVKLCEEGGVQILLDAMLEAHRLMEDL